MGVAALNGVNVPLTLFTSILLARGLGPEGFGRYSFVLATISMLGLPIGWGLGQLVTREVARYHITEDWGHFRGLLQRAHQWIIAVSAITVLLVALFAVQYASWTVDDRWTLLLISALILPFLGLNGLRSATLRGLRNVFFAQVPELLARPALHLVIIIGLLVTGTLNPALALVGNILATCLAFALGTWFLRRLKPSAVEQARPVYQASVWWYALLPFTLLAAVSTLNNQIGVLVLGWLGTDENVAALKVSASGATFVILTMSIINMVVGPYITRAHQNQDTNQLKRLSRQASLIALLFGFPIAFVLFFYGRPVVSILYGETYADIAATPLAILAAAQLFKVVLGPVGLFLTMTGYERDTLGGQITALVVTFIGAIVLIPLLGTEGAALSVAIGGIISQIVLALLFVKRMRFRPSFF